MRTLDRAQATADQSDYPEGVTALEASRAADGVPLAAGPHGRGGYDIAGDPRSEIEICSGILLLAECPNVSILSMKLAVTPNVAAE